MRHYADGSSYTGQWRRGKKEGEGTFTYKSGDSFSGEWVANRRHGSGTYRYADGASYDGRWVDDEHMRGTKKRGYGPEQPNGRFDATTLHRVAVQTNNELRAVISEQRTGVPLAFRRPMEKERRSLPSLQDENGRLAQYLVDQAHVRMLAKVQLLRQPSLHALAALGELTAHSGPLDGSTAPSRSPRAAALWKQAQVRTKAVQAISRGMRPQSAR